MDETKIKVWKFGVKMPSNTCDLMFAPDDFEPFEDGSADPDDLTTGNLGHRIEKTVMSQEEFGVLDHGGNGDNDFELSSYEMDDEHMLETITRIRDLVVEAGYKPTKIEYTEETVQE